MSAGGRGIAISLVVVACASPGIPPGGPVDAAAPEIVRIVPDSGRTGISPPAVIFRFNEVVSERPAGGTTLEGLFLISPRDGAPRVDWSREEVAVRPRRGWRANTTYTVSILPGVTDLRGNVRNTGITTVFSTGSTLAQSRLSGSVLNWFEGSFVRRGLVEARGRPDTTFVYVAATDSAGNFLFTNLPAGQYVVRGIADENNNRGLDPREPWDTVSVTLADSARTEIYAFVRDTAGTRLSTVALEDPFTILLTFDGPLSPTNPPTVANIRIRASDSTDVPVAAILPAIADTGTAAGARPARLGRPAPPRTLRVRVRSPLTAREYRVHAINVRNVIGVPRSSDRVLVVPPPAAPQAPAPLPPPPAAPSQIRR